jgi:uncharacterized membrane protein
MKQAAKYAATAVLAGLVVLMPIYLSALLLHKAMQSVMGAVRPLAKRLPDGLPAEQVLSLLLVLALCFLVGAVARTRTGRALRERVGRSLFERLPGYALFRSLAQQLAGEREEDVWKPAMVELDDALVPAFIIEDFEDGRFTVFVPSAPTPLSGAIYVLTPDRVHPVEAPFAHAVKALSQWGSGARGLVAAMDARKSPFGNRVTGAEHEEPEHIKGATSTVYGQPAGGGQVVGSPR